jgi:hypothetical protein
MYVDRLVRHRSLTAILCLSLLAIPTLGTSQESTSFRMERVTLASSADQASSTSFATSITLGQEVPSGSASACNIGYVQTLGFWSLFGNAPVPQLLRVEHDPLDPWGVRLTWSGSAASFEVFRSELPVDVEEPGNVILNTVACEATDSPPVEPELVYYRVLPDRGE